MFSWTKLLWKVLLVTAPVLVALGANVTVPDDFGDFEKSLIFVTIAVLAGVYKAVENLRKNWEKLSGGRKTFLPAILVCLVLGSGVGSGGCASNMTRFVDGTDGSSITMVDVVPIGMKRDLSAQNGKYTWLGDGSGEWTVGASLENTDGTESLTQILGLIGQLVPLLNGLTGHAAPAAPAPSNSLVLPPNTPPLSSTFPLMNPLE